MLIEICASSYQSAINAQVGGAHRIELCENLTVGGLTPNKALLIKVLQDISIPVHVLIRPRSGDFTYSESELDQMLDDIDFCKASGTQGIVSGILNSHGNIDIERTKMLIERSKPLTFTFHKAFDETPDPLSSLQDLITLGANGVLTSGHATMAIEGMKTLIALKDQAARSLEILVGGDVRASNVLEFKNAGFCEIHSSAIVSSDHSDLDEIKRLVQLATD